MYLLYDTAGSLVSCVFAHTGVMVGLPGQTLQDLANDLLFFKQIDADMIGKPPPTPHKEPTITTLLRPCSRI